MSGVPPPSDQPARTSMAWLRTALGSTAVAAVILRLSWIEGRVVPAAAAVTAAVGVGCTAAVRHGAMRRTVLTGRVRHDRTRGAAWSVVLATVTLAAVALVLVLGP